MRFSIFNSERGQALVTLLIFMVVALIVTSAAIIIIFLNSLSSSKVIVGELAYYTAESGIENAILRLLRNPSYAGETLAVDQGTATITVTGTEPKTITSIGKLGNFTRTLQVQVGYTNNVLTISSWGEIN